MNRIPDIIRTHISKSTFNEVDAFGIFTNEPSNAKKNITPGSVYGFFVELLPNEVGILIQEAKAKKSFALSFQDDFKPIVDNIYPLYWGKDKSLGSRINGHITNPDGKEQGKVGTGLVRLCAYQALQNKKIGVCAIVVDDYSEFESHIRSIYPNALKTKNTKL